MLAYSPLAQGYLTGKYRNGARPPGARTTLFERGSALREAGRRAGDRQISRSCQRTRTSIRRKLALAFVTSRPFVTSNIIGATTMAQLKTDLDSTQVTITPEIEARIDEIHHLHSNPAP